MSGLCTCGRSGALKRGMCGTCYQYWWRTTPSEDRPRRTVEDRFRAKFVQRGADECWEWTATNKDGYGQFFVSRERGVVPAQTFSVELATGVRCPEDREGCHTCDNPPCVNPAHVYYGTRKQNVGDMFARGRAVVGEQRSNAKFTADQIIDMRTRFAAGENGAVICRQYGITGGRLSNIVNGKEWKHVGGPIKTHNKPGRRNGRAV